VSHAGVKGGKKSTGGGCVREVAGMNEQGSTSHWRTACSYAVAGGRQHATREARARGAQARDRSPGGAPPCGRWRPKGGANDPRMASHASASRARAWMGGRRVLRARPSGRCARDRPGRCIWGSPNGPLCDTAPRSAAHEARHTDTGTGPRACPVSTRSPPRESGWGTRRATLDMRLPFDRLEGGGGPGANKDQSNLITGRLTPPDDGYASLPTFLWTFPAANDMAWIRLKTFKDFSLHANGSRDWLRDRADIPARAHRHCPFRRLWQCSFWASQRRHQQRRRPPLVPEAFESKHLLDRAVPAVAASWQRVAQRTPFPGSSTESRGSALSREARHLSLVRQVSSRSEILLRRASRATSFCQFVALYFRRVNLTFGMFTQITKVCTDDWKVATRSCRDRRLFVPPSLTSWLLRYMFGFCPLGGRRLRVRCQCVAERASSPKASAAHLVAGSTTSLVFPQIARKRSLKTGSCSHARSVCSYLDEKTGCGALVTRFERDWELDEVRSSSCKCDLMH